MKTIKIEDGKIFCTPPTKVETVIAIHFMWLHEGHFELSEDCHPSWKGYTQRTFAEIAEIIKSMTDEEKAELRKKIKPYPLPID